MGKFKKRIFDSQKLKSERIRRGLTYAGFANKLKIFESKASKSTCWQWENANNEPSARYMIAICLVLDRDISYFYKNKKSR